MTLLFERLMDMLLHHLSGRTTQFLVVNRLAIDSTSMEPLEGGD